MDAIEITVECLTPEDAEEKLNILKASPGYLGGKVWSANLSHTIVAFVEDTGCKSQDFLPMGCRMVEIPSGLLEWFGITGSIPLDQE